MPKKEKEPQKKQEVNNEVELLKAQLARTLADYDNLKKRVERQREGEEYRLKSQIFSRILPAMDMLYDVQKHLNDAGLAMVIGEFEESLKAEKILPIKANEGEDFDENLHEAVDVIEDGNKKGKIAELVQTGWRLEGENQVIRHAKVKVYK